MWGKASIFNTRATLVVLGSGYARTRPQHTFPSREEEPRRPARRQQEGELRLFDRGALRGRPQPDRHGDQIAPRGSREPARRLRQDRERRGLAARGAHLTVDAPWLRQSRAPAAAKAPAPQV